MRSEENNLFLRTAVKNQYVYKLNSYSGWFCSLILAQVIAVLFMFGGTMTCYSSITLHVYYAMVAVVFTDLWAVIISILLTTRQSKNESFTLPCSHLSDCLSDIAFMLTGCVFGGVTAALLSVAMRVPVYFMHMGNLTAKGFYPVFSEICIIAASTMLYILLLSAAGYLAGVLVRLSKVFYVAIPAFIIGTMCLVKYSVKSQMILKAFCDSIISEKSLGIFTFRVLIISALLLALGTVLSSSAEVRK